MRRSTSLRFPGPGGKRLVSTGGGALPRWRQDGREIFYVTADRKLMAAEVIRKGTALEIGQVRTLFGPLILGRGFLYDVSADGQRILAVTESAVGHVESMYVVQNWTNEVSAQFRRRTK